VGMVVLALLLACSRPVEAPQELDALVGFLFAHAMDEDPAALAAGGDNLAVWMDTRLDETLEGYAVRTLDQATLDGLDDATRSAEGLVGAAVGHESPHDPTTIAASQLTTDPLVRDADTVLAYAREDQGDMACFLDHRCGTFAYESWVTASLPLSLEVTSHNLVQWRWVELSDGGEALVQRNWMVGAAELNVDWLDVLAQYYLWVSIPHGDGSRNMYATWAQTRLTGTDVPETLALHLAVEDMVGAADEMDAWISANPAPSW
jgi:hypothetical protein